VTLKASAVHEIAGLEVHRDPEDSRLASTCETATCSGIRAPSSSPARE
jgi:hypothetical protein